jgi:hypothetical protein
MLPGKHRHQEAAKREEARDKILMISERSEDSITKTKCARFGIHKRTRVRMMSMQRMPETVAAMAEVAADKASMWRTLAEDVRLESRQRPSSAERQSKREAGRKVGDAVGNCVNGENAQGGEGRRYGGTGTSQRVVPKGMVLGKREKRRRCG